MKKIIFLIVLSSILFQYCSNKTRVVGGNTEKQHPRRAEVLFLGNESTHHNSSKLAPMLISPLFALGINVTYTADTSLLNTETLNKYDGIIIYGNYDTITPDKEKALKDFVEGGKALIPIHSASFCFQNSDWYIKAVGGQFSTHKTGVFSAVTVNKNHPVMKGVNPFSSWDETYVHTKLNPDMTVLQERVEGDLHEPYTWVRKQGKGRVFYTASGHNDSTWKQPDFIKLIGNGVLWALGDKVQKQILDYKIPVGVYSDANIPNYENRNPAPRFQHAFTPAESQKRIQVPVDFDIQLFASEPDIINPISMAWDEKGRLWVIETIDYPNTIRNKDGKGDDRIKICEDTDGDGKADKFTIFADGLNIPTSIMFSNGGVIVAQAPNFIFLKDTDGDDKADIRENLITGWGKSDTHAGPSNLKYGFDNKIWGVVGYSGFEGKIGDQNLKFGQGVYSFSPDGKNFDFKGRTSNNTWGLAFTEDNDVFISTANNTHTAFFSMPEKYMRKVLPGSNVQSVQKIDGHYEMHVVFPNLRQVDVHGGFTAAAGHNFYTARNFPKSYWNRTAFVCEPTGRVIHSAILEKEGAGFIEKDGWNFLASSDEWVGPVHAEVGPDGAVWVADWYDFIIQHNPTPRGFENGEGNAYINPLRDRVRGRVYRIKYKNAKPYTPIKLSKDNPEGLLSALENDNLFWRMTAQRLLVESKNLSVLPGLYKIINNQKVDEIGLNGPAVNAIWTLQGLGTLDGSNAEALKVVQSALSHPAAGVRKAAIQALPKDNAMIGAIQKANLLKDKDLRVRLAAILAISDIPASVHLGHLLYEAATDSVNAKDKYVAQALYTAALLHHEGFLAMSKTASSQSPFIQTIVKEILPNVKTKEVATSEKEHHSANPANEVVINIKIVEHVMKFNKTSFTVKAGQTVTINLENPDFMQHNMVIAKPGTLKKVGAAADEMAKDPNGAEKNYVPAIPEILFSTKLLNPEEKVVLQFTAPDKPGDYPFVCTFPGHWSIMNGIMKVTK
ncbi:PVC-type heme-binding CxxCH protein [Pedobacter foliorum]|uniref:PVC-type heme-binding CxxCH protein n=1 Tax=Pedobacter foliorum TaxID=2739058 RepID=UPI0015677617|nr:PVC-type heme-binding CxxCH protein [Pedobacter foliorum]NRF41164.1 ThuA domain-containing protein [Pedobacter foliorum]